MPATSPSAPSPMRHLPGSLMMVLSGIILFSFGFLAGYTYGGKASEGGYQQGFDAARKKIEALGLLPQTAQMQMLTGTVKSVSESSLTIEVPQTVRNPFEEPAPTVRTVEISKTTKILKLTAVTADEMEKDNAAFDAAQRKFLDTVAAGKPGTPPNRPRPFKEEPVALSAIAQGASISVTSGSDISTAASFEAAEIRLNATALIVAPLSTPPLPLPETPPLPASSTPPTP